MALIAVLIALSLRRNYLGQVVAGTVFVLFNRYRQVHMERFLSLALIVAVLLGVVFTAGQVVGNRLPLVQQLTEYVQLLNFASATSFTGVADNQVHLFNVQTYTLLLSRYGGIRLFGVSAAPTDNFRDFNREYLSSLGLAHNGPLRAIFEFGIGGLLVWSAFFFIAFRAVRRCRFERLEPWEQAVALGTGATVFSHFVITLTFVPPFFTTLKILFFFLVFVYVLEFYSRESNLPEAQAARPIVAADRYSLPPSADRNPYRRDFLCPPSS
jgi:hypothetical protein